MRALAFAASLAALGACGGTYTTEVPPVAANEDTTLGTGDVFEVRVYGEEGLSGAFRVSQEGTIDYPFVGRINVAGLNTQNTAPFAKAFAETR